MNKAHRKKETRQGKKTTNKYTNGKEHHLSNNIILRLRQQETPCTL
jgi:hypothetical protein